MSVNPASEPPEPSGALTVESQLGYTAVSKVKTKIPANMWIVDVRSKQLRRISIVNQKWVGAIIRVLRSLGIIAAISVPAALFVSGCALTTGHVNLSYQPTTQATKIAGANSSHVMVDVSDKRPTQVVGQKVNGYGMKTADIVSDSDVPGTLKGAFETELSNRGFMVGPGGTVISVRLDNFENQFTLGWFSGDATASMGMDVTVKRPNGSIAYNKYITGQGKDSVEIAGEGNAERMLNAAMQDGVFKVFSDSAFIGSLEAQ